ncbi:hypothetical protein M422DRAFT_270185 [Sphaerobolus stellatus SS14]|uniref:Uncharacterized protein n=1 Tax=Sphaerobolus stellatus (strain SS14) TaxID=990650 RepID=A0A0C9U2V4_SPHS4|nr:hypothetical protein M422DRAFT_270185 [Sphaerobolus stellatus SS14]
MLTANTGGDPFYKISKPPSFPLRNVKIVLRFFKLALRILDFHETRSFCANNQYKLMQKERGPNPHSPACQISPNFLDSAFLSPNNLSTSPFSPRSTQRLILQAFQLNLQRHNLPIQLLQIIRLQLLRDSCATPARLLHDSCATPARLLRDSCTTRRAEAASSI